MTGAWYKLVMTWHTHSDIPQCLSICCNRLAEPSWTDTLNLSWLTHSHQYIKGKLPVHTINYSTSSLERYCKLKFSPKPGANLFPNLGLSFLSQFVVFSVLRCVVILNSWNGMIYFYRLQEAIICTYRSLLYYSTVYVCVVSEKMDQFESEVPQLSFYVRVVVTPN